MMMMNILIHIVIVVLLLLNYHVVVVDGQFCEGDNSNTIGSRCIYYDLDNMNTTNTSTAIFSCTSSGSRCVFQRADYDDVDFGTGQQSDNTQGAIWAALDPTTDELTLTTCLGTSTATNTTTRRQQRGRYQSRRYLQTSPTCLVVCNANCTCELSDTTGTTMQNCTALASAPNGTNNDIVTTPSPVPPVSKTCPAEAYTEYCAPLMNNPLSLQPGNEKNFDCFNFCGGVFISSCSLKTGNCGTLTCNNATANATLNGLVFGCTINDFKNSTGGSGSGSGGGSSSSIRSVPSILTLASLFGMIAMMMIMTI